MNRYLYFAVTTTDSACIPVSAVAGMELTDADTLELFYEGIGAIDNNGKITLDCTSGSSKAAMELIVNSMNYGTDPFIVVSDVVNSVSLGHGLTVTAITL
tara:strand:+ start:35 stop:334 length:300 start_codon:yes stop_codon:yes gene_type:complete